MITAKVGDITQQECDAIVNPANARGTMGGGVALAIRISGGVNIEREAIEKGPIEPGRAIVTTAGNLPCKLVIHVSTVIEPTGHSSEQKVRLAVRTALDMASRLNLKTLAFPGMGTGVGRLERKSAARAMVEEARKYPNIEVRFIDRNEPMVSAWKVALSHLRDSIYSG